jgi:hypothetical protein
VRTRTKLAALVVAACGLAGAAVVATSSSPAQRNCVRDASGGGERCFDTYRTAIDFATHGAIVDAPLSARKATSDQHFKAEVMVLHERAGATMNAGGARIVNIDDSTGSTVIGATVFTGTNFTGDSLTITVPKPCVKNGLYDWQYSLGDYGHRVESVEPWANCWIWLHEGEDLDSARQGPYKVDTADLGDWKDRAVMVGLS